MKETREYGRHIIATTLLTLCAVGLYVLYLRFGILPTMMLALFATIPVSLLVPKSAIRYGILGAWIGAFVGFFPGMFISFLLMDKPATLERVGPLLGPICYGSGAIVGAAAGALLALRKDTLRK